MTIETRWVICFANDLRRAGQALDGLMKELGLFGPTLPVLERGSPCAAYSA